MNAYKRQNVFICYSHKDVQYLDQLVEHLAYYERNHLVEFWSDKKITAGAQWREEIKRAIESTKVAVLLISPSFLASEFIAENELPPLLHAAEKEGAIILPVIVRPSNFEDTELANFQAVNSPSTPVAKMKVYQRDEFWAKVVKDIMKAIVPQQIQSSTSSNQQSTIVQSIQAGDGTSLVAIRDNRKQTQYNSSRPLLVPEGAPKFQDDKPQWLDWNVNEQVIAIRNVGSGVALNVANILCGCESYVVDWATNKRSDREKSIHWTCWLGVPIASGETKEATHKKGNGIFYEKNMHIGQHSFNAPPEPRVVPHQNQPFIIARITITYLDIFRRKHASIFDYVQHTHGWQLVEFLEDIKEDLSDLEG